MQMLPVFYMLSSKYRKVFLIQFKFKIDNYTSQISCGATFLLPCIKTDLGWRDINTCFSLEAIVDVNWHNALSLCLNAVFAFD